MGLLDDAIRDHLELKRSRGADPSEIAREEREALEPVFPDEPRPPGFSDEPQATVLDEEPPHGDPLEEAAEAAEAPADAPVQPYGDETAELDMEAVLGADAPEGAAAVGRPLEESGIDAAADGTGPAEPVHAVAPSEDELLEWETPERGEEEPPPKPLPGQERMSFE
jgi:hypothetical protein